MKNLLFLLLLISVGISCEQDTFLDEEEDSTIELRNHEWTMSEIATIDSVISYVFNMDSTSINTILQKLNRTIENGIPISEEELLNEFGVPISLSEKYFNINFNYIVDEQGRISNSFIVNYLSFTKNNGSLINIVSSSYTEFDVILLLDQLTQDDFTNDTEALFGSLCGGDPCSFCNTVNTVVVSAGGMAFGTLGGPWGFLFGVANAADNAIKYAQNCG